MMETKLSPGCLAFIALCNEYCSMIENSVSATRSELVAGAVRLLPRIYISACDLEPGDDVEIVDLEEAMDEPTYMELRGRLEELLGAADTYLEVFEEDMKYSDTPIAASVSEGLADLMQVMYNFIATVRDATTDLIPGALAAMKEHFTDYWSQTLCNVMRPLNQLRFNAADDEEI